jgi:hypothetical protein
MLSFALLQQLLRTGSGCHIGTHFVGPLTYADDIVLVALTPTAMREMLSICNRLAMNNDVCFNATKSKCVIMNSKSSRHCTLYKYRQVNSLGLEINGNKIEVVEHYKHLGHISNSTFDDINCKKLSSLK